jgi:hypothetical protein
MIKDLILKMYVILKLEQWKMLDKLKNKGVFK